MTKEIHDINTRALDFVVELIEYIFEYPDDDYMTMECLCRKLHKHGLVDKKNGFYLVAGDMLCENEPQTECKMCKHYYGKDHYDIDCELLAFDRECRYEPKNEPQTEREEEQ